MIKKFIPLIAGVAIAVASFFAYDLPIGDAISIATDNDQAKAACERLLTAEGNQPAEAKAAIE